MIAINLHSQKEPKKTKYYGKGLRKKQLLKKAWGKYPKLNKKVRHSSKSMIEKGYLFHWKIGKSHRSSSTFSLFLFLWPGNKESHKYQKGKWEKTQPQLKLLLPFQSSSDLPKQNPHSSVSPPPPTPPWQTHTSTMAKAFRDSQDRGQPSTWWPHPTR